MKNHSQLDSFVLVQGGEVISPALTTTREYGAWFGSTFDNYTSGQTLYCKAKTKDGQSVLESHPGTRIGKYYDTHSFKSLDLNCWYLKSDGDLIKQLIWYKLADPADCISNKYGRVLRVYTISQIEMYIKDTIDKSFVIGGMVLPSKKVQVSDSAGYIKPKRDIKKRRLF